MPEIIQNISSKQYGGYLAFFPYKNTVTFFLLLLDIHMITKSYFIWVVGATVGHAVAFNVRRDEVPIST
jgi:hypothetical protein